MKMKTVNQEARNQNSRLTKSERKAIKTLRNQRNNRRDRYTG